MIKIQRLKEPKKGKSGEQVLPGEMLEFKGIVLKNNNKFPVYVSFWKRPGQDYINRKRKSKEQLALEKKRGPKPRSKNVADTEIKTEADQG